MAQIFGMMMQAAQQQQQGQLAQQQDYFRQTNPLGATALSNARPGGLTPGSEWSSMFGDNAASAMTPEARMASQGGSAVNQWANPGRYAWNGPAQADPNMGMLQTNTTPFQMPQPLTSPMGGPASDAANLQQNMSMYSPGGSNTAQMPTQTPRKKPAMRKGSSFGMQASASPRPGFGF